MYLRRGAVGTGFLHRVVFAAAPNHNTLKTLAQLALLANLALSAKEEQLT
jgi:hypothetical protein